MGWKLSVIIIHSEQAFDQEEFFDALGYSEPEAVGQDYFDSIMNPDDDKIYIGTHRGNTIICS